MGRRPKSPEEKRITGAGRRPASAVAPAVAVADGEFRAPPWLVGSAEVGVWNRVVPELRRLNMLAPSDADVFARYCRHFATWLDACATLDREGHTALVKMTNSEERMPRLHPAVKVRELAEKHLVEIEDRFGGSPLARFRLIAQSAAHPGAFGDLFARVREGDADAPPPVAAVSTIGVLQPRPTVN